MLSSDVSLYLTHPAVRRKALAGDLALVRRSEDDVHLALLLLPQTDDLVLQEQVLAAVVGEHDDEGPGRGDLESHHQALGQPLLAVTASVVRLELEGGGGQAELAHVVCVDLREEIAPALFSD